ncbi:MAG: L-threonylcarbamoyladenylate synthase [Corallococcus sp.]|nr:L-threonylcarbamoyladenylate synthase [Corallococcus sp.]
METKYLQFNAEDLRIAGEMIRNGELVAFPTETVYGLGANALDAEAVKRTYEAKGRPSDNPLIAHVYDKSQIYEIASFVSEDAEKIINVLMPASITIVLPKKSIIDDVITAGLNTVAIRMPSSCQARAFLRAAQVPVTAPSANLSGRPSPTTWQRVREDLDGKISAVLCGSPCNVGIESTVLDLSGEEPLILRPGAVTADVLSDVLSKHVGVVTDPKAKVNSPGVRYKHYAPKVPMALELDGDTDKLVAFYDSLVLQGVNPVLLAEHPEKLGKRNCVCIGRTDEEVAQKLFENLRVLEKTYDYIIASFSSKTTFAESILNRLIRSAANNII